MSFIWGRFVSGMIVSGMGKSISRMIPQPHFFPNPIGIEADLIPSGFERRNSRGQANLSRHSLLSSKAVRGGG